MNLVFHVGAALALLWLCFALVAAQRQRNLLRSLFSRNGTVTVATPKDFVRAIGGAFGVEVEGAPALPPARIDLAPWTELFSTQSPKLLRWRGSPAGPALHVVLGPGQTLAPALAERLARSLGGGVTITGEGENA